jgi:hypothetical protein
MRHTPYELTGNSLMPGFVRPEVSEKLRSVLHNHDYDHPVLNPRSVSASRILRV